MADGGKMSPVSRILAAIALLLTALLIVVIVWGLADKKLDPTGTAGMLGGVLTGVVGALIWGKRNDGGDDR
jgi:uncharacterized membrane protein YeaQ/YmgE (transglycosylase-associated protein family)